MDNREFIIENGVLIKYQGEFQRVVIPQEVTHISGYAFDDTDIKHLLISKNVEVIDDNLFSRCDKLEYVEASEDNSIFSAKNGVLFDKSLETLLAYPQSKDDKEYHIPETVNKIYRNAFYFNEYIEKLYIPGSVYDLSGFILGCTSLQSVEVSQDNPNFAVEDDMLFNKEKTILLCDLGIYWRKNVGLEYKVPESVVCIDENANFPQAITRVRIHKNVQSLNAANFLMCNMDFSSGFEAIEVDSKNTKYASVDGVLFDKRIKTLLCYPPFKKALSYKLPETVETISDYGIVNAYYLELLDLSNITKIKGTSLFSLYSLKAFSINKNNTELAVKDGVLYNKDFTILYRYPAGKECEEYVLPKSIIIIQSLAFYECDNLIRLVIPNENVIMDDLAISCCDFEIVTEEYDDEEDEVYPEEDNYDDAETIEYDPEEFAEKVLANAAEKIENIKYKYYDSICMAKLIKADGYIPTVIALARNGNWDAQFEIESRLALDGFSDAFDKEYKNDEKLKKMVYETINNIFIQETPFDKHMKAVAEYLIGNYDECTYQLFNNFENTYIPSIFSYGKYGFLKRKREKRYTKEDLKHEIGFIHVAALNGYGPAIAWDECIFSWLSEQKIEISDLYTPDTTVKKYQKLLGDEQETVISFTNCAQYMGKSRLNIVGGFSDKEGIEKFCRNLNIVGKKNIPTAEALYNYAEFLEKNDHIAYEKTFKLYEESAELDNPKACLKLAEIYCGKSDISNLMRFNSDEKKKALVYYEKAAQYNIEAAQALLGREYLYGGTLAEKDYNKAVYWLEKASENGNAEAMYFLGAAYYSEENTEKPDYEKAVKYFKLSANKGNKFAMCLLGKCYFYGQGVEKNNDEARKLSEQSYSLGCSTAKETLKKIKAEEKSLKKEESKQISTQNTNVAVQKPTPKIENPQPVPETKNNAVPKSISHEKDKNVAAVLAILLGTFGVHHFYMRKYVKGIFCILFSWTYIPSVIGVIQGVIYLAQSQDRFNKRYKPKKTNDTIYQKADKKYCTRCGNLLNDVGKCDFCGDK